MGVGAGHLVDQVGYSPEVQAVVLVVREEPRVLVVDEHGAHRCLLVDLGEDLPVVGCPLLGGLKALAAQRGVGVAVGSGEAGVGDDLVPGVGVEGGGYGPDAHSGDVRQRVLDALDNVPPVPVHARHVYRARLAVYDPVQQVQVVLVHIAIVVHVGEGVVGQRGLPVHHRPDHIAILPVYREVLVRISVYHQLEVVDVVLRIATFLPVPAHHDDGRGDGRDDDHNGDDPHQELVRHVISRFSVNLNQYIIFSQV